MSLHERLRRQSFDTPTGCRQWTGYTKKDRKGYGYGMMVVLVHRLAYELAKGPIGDTLHVDHLCGNRGCINPDHLEAVSAGENQRRAHLGVLSKACRRGHPWTPESTQRTPTQRYCRTCDRERRQARAEVAA